MRDSAVFSALCEQRARLQDGLFFRELLRNGLFSCASSPRIIVLQAAVEHVQYSAWDDLRGLFQVVKLLVYPPSVLYDGVSLSRLELLRPDCSKERELCVGSVAELRFRQPLELFLW